VTARDGLGFVWATLWRLRTILAAQTVVGAVLLLVSRAAPSCEPVLRPLAIGALASLVPNVLGVPLALLLANTLAWGQYRRRVPSPSVGERWRFASLATWRGATGRKARGMVAVSDRRVVFVASERAPDLSIALADVVSTRLEAKRAWHLGLEYEVHLERASAPSLRVSSLDAQTFRRLVAGASADLLSDTSST
jgi:hypothetical protein